MTHLQCMVPIATLSQTEDVVKCRIKLIQETVPPLPFDIFLYTYSISTKGVRESHNFILSYICILNFSLKKIEG